MNCYCMAKFLLSGDQMFSMPCQDGYLELSVVLMSVGSVDGADWTALESQKHLLHPQINLGAKYLIVGQMTELDISARIQT